MTGRDVEVVGGEHSCLPELELLAIRRPWRRAVGPAKVPEDPLAGQRRNVADFEALLAAVDDCQQQLAAAVAALRAAAGPVLEQLQRLYPGDASRPEASDEEPLVVRLAAELGTCVARVVGAEPQLLEMKSLMRKLRAETARAEAAFGHRDEAWQAKAHYDRKLRTLKNHPSRSGPGFTMEDKVTRNKMKQRRAEAAFQKATDEAAKAAHSVACGQWPGTAALLAKLCHCNAAVFGSAELDVLARRFAEAPPLALRPATAAWSALGAERLPVAGVASDGAPEEAAPAAAPEGGPAESAVQAAEDGCSDSSAAEEEPAVDSLPAVPAGSQAGFKQGDKVQVWSNSEATWLDGVVEEVYSTSCVMDGYSVPAGTVRVSYASGMKYVTREQASTLLRPADAVAMPRFSKGQTVHVWSSSESAWLEGMVEEVYEEASVLDGYSVPAGCVKVSSSAGTKFVPPERLAELLKAAGPGATGP